MLSLNDKPKENRTEMVSIRFNPTELQDIELWSGRKYSYTSSLCREAILKAMYSESEDRDAPKADVCDSQEQK